MNPENPGNPSADGGRTSSDPDLPEGLEERVKAVMAAEPWIQPEAMQRTVERIYFENSNFASKHRKLVRLADRMNAALDPYTPCHRGCHHCCAMAVLIYRFEAVALAKASGRTMRELPYRPRESVIAANEAAPIRMCPFVVNGVCSVYDVRPMICRLHHSLNAQADDCQMTEAHRPIRPAYMYDVDLVETPYHGLVMWHSPWEPWGTIAEFFPPADGSSDNGQDEG